VTAHGWWPHGSTPAAVPAARPGPATTVTEMSASESRDRENPATWSLPSRLSPSRATEYAQCPRRFFYRSVVGLPDPPSEATAKGTWVHAALEDVFDLPREERTVEATLDALAVARDRLSEDASLSPFLADENVALGAEQAVRNWFTIEDPRRFDPAGREVRLETTVGQVSVVGVIDRLDEVGGETWISDYKTGKQPDLRWAEKSFFAMRVYASLVQRELGRTVTRLRLVYLSRQGADAVLSMAIDGADVARTESEIKSRWSAITRSARTGEWTTRPSKLCGWCPFSDICPAQHPELDGVEGIPTPVPISVARRRPASR